MLICTRPVKVSRADLNIGRAIWLDKQFSSSVTKLGKLTGCGSRSVLPILRLELNRGMYGRDPFEDRSGQDYVTRYYMVGEVHNTT